MVFQDYIDRSGHPGVSGAFSLLFDRTVIDGTPADLEALCLSDKGYTARYGPVQITGSCEQTAEGVLVCDTLVRNTGDRCVQLRRALNRFTLDGGEFEVYTQYSGWINESRGRWQPLHTGVTAENRELRTNENASPVLALWNRQTQRGIIFHVFANCSWLLSARTRALSRDTVTVVELGVNDAGFDYPLQAGEALKLPRILAYTFENKRDLGCEKLHAWFNRCYPRREMPVICNSWMMTFDRICPEKLKEQVLRAAEAGAEYFVIDAGWFGNDGRWYENIGSWEENLTEAFAGQMAGFADFVRAHQMKFGLWLEVERALPNVKSVREHPDWYFFNGRSCLLDFSNEDARKTITETVCALTDRYGIDFIKSDFNDSVSYDPAGCGFLKYHEGHEKYLADIRAHRPGIYLENCASGGQRMELYSATLYDSCWISDHHSPYDETRILLESSLRMTPNAIEKWPVLKSAEGFLSYEEPGLHEKIIACNDASWGNVQGINEDWLRACVKGSVLGFSCDLSALSGETFRLLRDVIREYREEREFFRRAVSTVLCDTEQITAMEYKNGSRSVITVFVWRRAQRKLTLIPTLTGKELTLDCPDTLHAAVLTLCR